MYTNTLNKVGRTKALYDSTSGESYASFQTAANGKGEIIDCEMTGTGRKDSLQVCTSESQFDNYVNSFVNY